MTASKKPGKVIALTGATGFVGGALMREALKAGHKVRALTRRPVEPIENVEWVSGDLDADRAIKTLLEGADAFVHTAGLVKARTADDFFRVNSEAVGRILELTGETPVAGDFHFMLVSSLAARHPELSPYAKSKREGEERLREADPSFAWTVLRPPAVYGPGDREILKLFRAMKRGVAPVAGKQDNVFSLIHAGDLARAVLSALHHEGAFGRVIEPDDRKKSGYTIAEVAKTAEGVMGRKVRPVEIPTSVLTLFAGANELMARFSPEPAILSRGKVREMVHPNWVADQKTHKIIPHWRPELDLERGFRDTLNWYKTHRLL